MKRFTIFLVAVAALTLPGAASAAVSAGRLQERREVL